MTQLTCRYGGRWCSTTVRGTIVHGVTNHPRALAWKSNYLFIYCFSYLTLATWRIFKAPPVFLREIKKEKERERKKKTLKPHLLQDTSFPHLVLLFLAPLISALLAGRGVTTQAPSSSSNNNTKSNNTSNKKNPRTPSQEKFATFNIKQQIMVFLELNCKDGKKS